MVYIGGSATQSMKSCGRQACGLVGEREGPRFLRTARKVSRSCFHEEPAAWEQASTSGQHSNTSAEEYHLRGPAVSTVEAPGTLKEVQLLLNKCSSCRLSEDEAVQQLRLALGITVAAQAQAQALQEFEGPHTAVQDHEAELWDRLFTGVVAASVVTAAIFEAVQRAHSWDALAASGEGLGVISSFLS